MPSRMASLVVALGAVGSSPDSIAVLARPTTPLPLQVGEVRVLRAASELACLRLEPSTGAQYLLIQQNVSDVVGSLMPFELNSLTGTGPLALRSAGSAAADQPQFGVAWEARLRAQERAFRGISAEPMPMALRVTPPQLGDRQSFQVLDRNQRFVTVTAEVKAISERAIVYQDVNAPANGFSESQFRLLGSQFDSPIYEVDVSVFGEPSDIDANGKVIILLTPVVNELTPRGANGYVAGFFFGCDLQSKTQCAGSNGGEIFYVFVPDPTGRHGEARSTQLVLNTTMPVLAHEFQHMISFGARKMIDKLWLSEGLAHHAEDLVADEYRRRGDLQSANLYTLQNYSRARLFLRDSTYGSLLSEELPGSLEQRGAGWLLVKYLAGHYGGGTLLRTLSRSTLSGIENVSAATGQPWSGLLADWAVALWADDAPEFSGLQINTRHTLNNINLRQVMGAAQTSYPLRVTQLGFSDVLLAGSLAASTQRYALLDGTATPALPVNLAFTGPLGGAFALTGVPQLTLLRIR
jgi:hypothetical protein